MRKQQVVASEYRQAPLARQFIAQYKMPVASHEEESVMDDSSESGGEGRSRSDESSSKTSGEKPRNGTKKSSESPTKLVGPEVEHNIEISKVSVGTSGYFREATNCREYPYVLYPVKVLQIDKKKKSTPFKVHFQGWKTRYDRWVDVIVEDTPQVRQRNQQLKRLVAKALKEQKAEELRKTKKLSRESSGSSLRKRKRSRTRDAEDDLDDADKELHDGKTPMEAAQEGILRISIPIPLKRSLIDDFERITQRRALVRLPKKHSVHQILQEFCRQACQPMGLASSVGKVREEDLKATVDGLAILFERALESNLLYEFELLQYDAIREQNPGHEDDHLVAKPNAVRNVKGKRLVHIYGAEHLLRYIYCLPELLRTSELLPNEIDLYRRILNGLMRFISKNRERYLTSESYVEASPEYIAVLQDFKPIKVEDDVA